MVVPLLGAVLALAAQDTVSFTLPQAVARTVAVSPSVAAAEGAAHAPRGARAESIWPLPSPPTFTFSRLRRRGPGVDGFDHAYSVRQEIDVTGQGFLKAAAAGSRVAAAQSLADDARRLTALEGELAYVRLAVMEQRAAVLDSAARTSERLADIARRQLDAGAINRLEANAALLDAGRQRSLADRAFAERGAAAADLGRLLALPTDSVPHTAGLATVPDAALPALPSLLALALSRRPDLAAAGLEVAGARKDVTANRLAQLPTLEVGVDWGSELSETLRGFTIGMRVPLFRRNQAGRGLALAEQTRAIAEADAARRRVQAEVTEARERWVRARAAERRLSQEVLRAAEENVALSQRALEEGRAGIPDVLLFRSVAVAVKVEYLDVLRDAHAAWFSLASALGVSVAELARLGGTSQ
ncbi:MAG: TolC family protein [Gemmatimonadales bacterium]